MLGVGSGTTIDHVEVRRTGPTDHPCFDVVNGRVNLKYLVCQHGGDDHFRFSQGYQGKAQFLFSQRFESGDALRIRDGNTNVEVYNATFVGHMDGADRTGGGIFVTDATFGVYNSIIEGFRPGLDVAGTNTNREVKGTYFFRNGPNIAYDEDDGGYGEASITNVNSPRFNDDEAFNENEFVLDPDRANKTNVGLENAYDQNKPQLAPGEAYTDGAQTPPAGFFTEAKYVGAVKDIGDKWMAGWVVFSEQ